MKPFEVETFLDSTLVICACGWRDWVNDQLHARRKIADHRVAAHGMNPKQAATVVEKYLSRLRMKGATA